MKFETIDLLNHLYAGRPELPKLIGQELDREWLKLEKINRELVQIDVERVRDENLQRSLAQVCEDESVAPVLPHLSDEDVDQLSKREEKEREEDWKRHLWLEESASCMEDAHAEQERDL